MLKLDRTGNTVGIKWHGGNLTFWQRAAASAGWTEAYRHRTGWHASVHVCGWAVSLEFKLATKPDYYHRCHWHINLPLLAYNANRGGAFTYFKVAQRVAAWRQHRANARRVLALQLRRDWWLRRGGQWWTFDQDARRSYYKFQRAVYGLEADIAWHKTKEFFDDRARQTLPARTRQTISGRRRERSWPVRQGPTGGPALR